MSGDYSRDRFDPTQHYSGVLQQQGRVGLDSDANEDAAIRERRFRVGTLDTVGRTGVPETTPDAFKIEFAGDLLHVNWLSVGPGRIYVDGLLAENHGAVPRSFDPVLGELYGGEPLRIAPPLQWRETVPFISGERPPLAPQPPAASGSGSVSSVSPTVPDLAVPNVGPEPPAVAPAPVSSPFLEPPLPAYPHVEPGFQRASVYLVYLEVWQREVDALQAPELIEPAIGVDTTTRAKIEWKVRFLPLPIATQLSEGRCDPTLWENEPAWQEICAASTGRLRFSTITVSKGEYPCDLPPTGGYRGRENQLYRVEIHDVRPDGTARFKWSRDNASVATAVLAVVDATHLQVASVGRDDVLGFHDKDWIEIISDADELAADGIHSGFMARIAAPPTGQILELDRDVSETLKGWIGHADQVRENHLRVRRWDQQPGPEKSGNYTDGLIPVVIDGPPVALEAGIQVQFSKDKQSDGAGPAFRAGDYWLFAARTADPSFEELKEAPPAGIHRHYAPLALVDFRNRQVRDCRVKFPSLTGALNFFYLGGDGQEVTFPSDANSIKVPAPLRVGVSRGPLPVAGMAVRFDSIALDHSLRPQTAVTGSDGVAECQWEFYESGLHVAEVRLINGAGEESHLPIRFTAKVNPPVAAAGVTCAVPVGPPQSLQLVLEDMAAKGEFDICICLAPGTYQMGALVLDPYARSNSEPARGKTLSITGCGRATCIQIEEPIKLSNWSRIAFSNLAIVGGSSAGALIARDCNEVTLERCEVAAIADIDVPVVWISGACKVEIRSCVIEAEHRLAHNEKYERFEQFFYEAKIKSLADLFFLAGPAAFEEKVGVAVDALTRECLQIKNQVMSAYARLGEQASQFFTEAERGSLRRLLDLMGSNCLSRDDIANALRAMRRAALQATPAPALVLEPSPSVPLDGDLSGHMPLRAGDQEYRVCDSTLVGVLGIAGCPPEKKPVSTDYLKEVCEKLKETRTLPDNGDCRVIVGCMGALWINRNRIALIAMGKPVFENLMDTFERIICSENSLEGPGSCLIAQQVVVTGNVFSRLADWHGLDAGHNCIDLGAGNLQGSIQIGTELPFFPRAVIIGNDPVIQGNQGAQPLCSLQMANPNDVILILTPPRPMVDDFTAKFPAMQFVADNLQNASLEVRRLCEGNGVAPAP